MSEVQIQLKKEGCLAGEIRFTHDTQTSVGRIQYVRIAKHLRGNGLGKRLMNKALEQLDLFGCKEITLSAKPLEVEKTERAAFFQSLDRLISFYKNFGFELTQATDETYPYPNDRMIKKLTGSALVVHHD